MSIEFLSPSFQTSSPNLCFRAGQNLELYKKNRILLVASHLDLILKDLERIILKESLINGKSSIEYDVAALPISSSCSSSNSSNQEFPGNRNSQVPLKVNVEKLSDFELGSLLDNVIQWLKKENLTVKQPFEKSMCMNLRTKLLVSWSSSGFSDAVAASENSNQVFEKGLPVLMTFPIL